MFKKKEAETLIGLLKLKRVDKEQALNHIGYKYKTNLQLGVLNRIFKITHYPSSKTRYDLAILLRMPHRSVQIWFQNTRQQVREMSINSEEMKKEATFKDLSCEDLLKIFLVELHDNIKRNYQSIKVR